MGSFTWLSRCLAVSAPALALACAALIGGLSAAPASASAPALAPAPMVASSAIMRVMPDGALAPLPSANVIKPTVTASGIKTYVVTEAGYLSGIHTCTELGTDPYGHEAIVCANMWAQPGSGGTILVAPAIQAYCQVGSTDTDVTCANIDESMAVGLGSGGTAGGGSAGCGHSLGSCPANQKYTVIGVGQPVSGNCKGIHTQDEVWTVIKENTSVELPVSDETWVLSSNLSSQHALICD